MKTIFKLMQVESILCDADSVLPSAVTPHHAMQVALKPGMWNAETWNGGTKNPEHRNRKPRTWNAGTENSERWSRKPGTLERWNRKA